VLKCSVLVELFLYHVKVCFIGIMAVDLVQITI